MDDKNYIVMLGNGYVFRIKKDWALQLTDHIQRQDCNRFIMRDGENFLLIEPTVVIFIGKIDNTITYEQNRRE